MSMIDATSAMNANQPMLRDRSAMPTPLSVAKALHWVIAFLVLGMFASGIIMTQIGFTPLGGFLFSAHKLCGILVFMLLVGRLAYRIQAQLRGLWHPEIGGRTVHYWLYALAILVPLLGWAGISDYGARTVFFGIVLPQIWPEGAGYSSWLFSAHAWLSFGLIAVVIVHIGIALQSHVMRGSARQDKG